MEGSKLDGYLSRGEGLSLEFKRCGNQPGADTFETICSFANRQGGSILLGVLDDGAVEGIDARAVSAIERNIVNVVNNPDLFKDVYKRQSRSRSTAPIVRSSLP